MQRAQQVNDRSPSQRDSYWNLGLFTVSLNELLNKQLSEPWTETPWCPPDIHCKVIEKVSALPSGVRQVSQPPDCVHCKLPYSNCRQFVDTSLAVYSLLTLYMPVLYLNGELFQNLMSSQIKESLNFYFSITYTSFNLWINYFVWNFKGYLWNSIQNSSPIHWKKQFLHNREIFKSSKF